MGSKIMSAQTVAEKILSRHAGKILHAGDFAVCKVDFAFGQDGTSSIIIDRINELGITKIKIPFCMVIDHSAPSPSEGVSRVHKKMRDFSKKRTHRWPTLIRKRVFFLKRYLLAIR